MTRVLLIGYTPESVNFSDPALPPGLDAGTIAAAIEVGLARIRERGWDADFCAVRPDDGAGPEVARRLSATHYDCIVIGGGIRMGSRTIPVFEQIIDAVRKTAPQTPIAFNSRPDDSADAAARWLPA